MAGVERVNGPSCGLEGDIPADFSSNMASSDECILTDIKVCWSSQAAEADGGYSMCSTQMTFSDCDSVTAADAICTETPAEEAMCISQSVAGFEATSMVFYTYEGENKCAGMEFMNADGALGLMDAAAVGAQDFSENSWDIPSSSRFMGVSMDSATATGSPSWYVQYAVSDDDWAAPVVVPDENNGENEN
jgi:hypothetical protein